MYKYIMSICTFSTMGSGLSLGQIIVSGSILLPLTNPSFLTTDVTTSTVSITNNALLNGSYTISCINNYSATYSMGYAFNNISQLNSTNIGWYSKSLNTPANLQTFTIINEDGTTSSITAVWLQIALPYYYSNIYSYNILSAVKWPSFKTRMPRVFYVLGSNNNTNWYVLHYVSNITTFALPSEYDMSSNRAVLKKNANFNYIRVAVIDTYENTASDKPVLISQFYVKGTPITTFNSQQLFYRFNNTQITGGTNLGNFATGTLVYDASLSNSNALSSNNTLELSTTGNVKINKTISTDANGLSFSFSMKMSPDLSYNGNVGGFYPIFDIANGRGTDNIVFGVLGNKIYTSDTSGNAWSGTVDISNGFTSNIRVPSTTTSFTIAQFSSYENYLVINEYNPGTSKNNVYYIKNNIRIQTTAFDMINPLEDVCITANGNRVIGVINNSIGSNVVWYSTLQSNGVYTNPTYITGIPLEYTCICTTSTGNRVIFANNTSIANVEIYGNIYYLSWNGTTYDNVNSTGLSYSGMTQFNCSFDGSVLVVPTRRSITVYDYVYPNGVVDDVTSGVGKNIYIHRWNNTNNNYVLVQTVPTNIQCQRTILSHNTNYIFFISIFNPYPGNNQPRLSYLPKINDLSYATNSDFTMEYLLLPQGFVGGGRGIGLTPDQTNLLIASNPSGQFVNIYKIPISISNTNTHYNIYNTAINDNVWRDYLWTIANDGTYTYYVNGTQVYQSSSGLLYPPTTARTLNFIGKSNSNPDSFFIGEIDNFRMHNRAVGINEFKNMINTVPDAPMYFYVYSNTSNSATLSFVEPIQPVNFYDISAVPTSGTTVTARIGAPANSYTLTGLLYGTYTASISAVNVFGRSSQITTTILIITTFFDLLYLYYRFNPADLNGTTNIGNYATQTIIYDASLSVAGITSTNTLALSTTGNLIINKTIIPTTGGLSFSFTMKMATSASYSGSSSGGINPIFDFGNGAGTDNILFGTIGNKIYTNITSGNTATSGTLTFGNYTTPWSSTTITADGYAYGLSNGFAMSSNETIAVYVLFGSRTVYVSKKTGSSWGAFTSIGTVVSNVFLTGVAMSADGSRIAGPFRNNGTAGITNTLWFSTLNTSTGNYNTITEVAGTLGYYTGIAMSADGNRIVLSNNADNALYYSTWTGTTYRTPVNSNLVTDGLYSCGISKDGNIAVAAVNSATRNIYIGTWNGSGYTLIQTLIPSDTGDVYSFAFSNDNNTLFLSKNNNSSSGLFYTKWDGSEYNTTLTKVPTSAMPANTTYNGIVLSFDESSIYALVLNGPTIYRTALTISNSQTNTNIYNTAINDDISRNYAWTISPTGTYTYYVNGSQVFQSSSGLLYPPTTARTLNYIGKSNSNPANYFVGTIDEFTMHNRELTASEVAVLPGNF